MASPSIPNPPGPLKLYGGVSAHLAFIVERPAAACAVCGQGFDGDELPPPACERCGLAAFHFRCYVDAVALAPVERAIFAQTVDDPATDPVVIFLCSGCRS